MKVKTMTENEIDTLPVHPTSWRDNKTALWLVRIGFFLQFYIPMFVCCYFVYDFSTIPYYTMSVDDPQYDEVELEPSPLDKAFLALSILTFPVLVVQCTIFTLKLRSAQLHSVETILRRLIIINVLHSFLSWGFLIFLLIPITLIRLTPPTILYLIAIRIESKANIVTNAGV